jgi:alkylhydroperoxidase/carboxymuconolactone decarboxylase family protein YurZ
LLKTVFLWHYWRLTEIRSNVMTIDDLPPLVQEVAAKHPAVWDAFNRLGNSVAQAGPLDEKTQRLTKLAIAMGAGLQGAVHSHVRRAMAEGITVDEMRHVAMLAITTIGWPSAIARLSWIEDIVSPGGESQRRSGNSPVNRRSPRESG